MIRSFTSFIIFLLLNTIVFGQESDSVKSPSAEVSMITNRPGFTEASRAVFKSGLQIESGFQYSKDQLDKSSMEYWESVLLPNLGVIYGVSKNVGVRAFVNYEANRFTYQDRKTKYYYNFSRIYVGTKINLTKEKGLLPEMALLINQGIPTNRFGISIWSTSALMAWSYTLNPRFGLSGNRSYSRDYEFKSKTNLFNQDYWAYTINLGYSITDEISVFTECYGNHRIDNDGKFDINLIGGMAYRITPKLQVDSYAGYRIETDGFLVNAGFSWLLLKD